MNTENLRAIPVFLVLAALLAAPAGAATPSSGTLSESSPVVTWTGNPQPPTASATCSGPDNPACDNFALNLIPPSFPFAVEITVTAGPSDDYDLEVYDPAGALAGSSGNSPGEAELVTLAAPAAGTYTVSTANFAAVLAYSGRAEIVEVDPDDPPAEGPGVTFSIHPAPGGMGTNSGEPSVGVNWNSDRVMFIAGLETLRVDFDDCSSPAADAWEDVSFTTTSAITLDPILFTDPITGRTFASQLGPKCSSMAFTDDDGETWTPSQGCGINAGVDHQSVGGGRFADPLTRDPNGPLYPHAVYYCSQDVAVAQCARSDTGGLTFNEATPIYNITECGGLHGHVKISPDDGTVYVPNKGCNGEQAVAVSSPDGPLGGNGLPGTWEVRRVPGTTTGEWDPSVGIGADGTLYIGMTNGGRPMIAVSTDKGLTWSDPVDVGIGAGPTGNDILNTAFPVVAAGDGDRAAFGFLGAEQGGAGGGQDASSGHLWHPYVAVTFDRGASWSTVNLTPGDPVQRGTICSSGTTCNSTRNLLDFNDMAIDREGRIVFAYADGCIGGCAKQGPNSASELATIGRQKGGQRMFAAYDSVGEPAAPSLSAVRLSDPSPIGRLAWQEPFDGNSEILGYNVYRRRDDEPAASLLAVLGAGTFGYDDATIAEGFNYCYQVTAENAFGESQTCGEQCLEDVVADPTHCELPGIPAVSDPLGDTNAVIDATGDPSLDLEGVFLAEPDLGVGAEKLVVTIKVDDLSLPHPSAAWRALWTSPDGGVRYVSLESCNAAEGITCSYGTFDGTLFSSQGDPEGCSFTDDGTITITVDKALVGISDATDVGDFLSGVEGRSQVFFGALCTGLLGNADTAGPGDNYQVRSNESCRNGDLPPVARDDEAFAIEGVPEVIDVLANDSATNGPLTVVAVSAPAHGAVTDNGDGTVTYLSDVPFSGVDSFTYTVEDASGLQDSATVTVRVDPICDPEPTGSFADDFEPDADPGWQVDTVVNAFPLSQTWAVVTDSGATSPTHSFFSDAQTLDSKDDRLLAPPQDLSATSQLVFWHRFEFEDTYDGGVLEVSTDSGSTWVDVEAGGGVFAEGGYNGTVNAGFGSPIAGRNAWTGGSAADPMTRVTVDLGAFAGPGVLVRFRLAADPLALGSVPGAGWWLDDVTFTNTLEPGVCSDPVAVDDEATTDAGTAVTVDVLANDFHPDGAPLAVAGITQPGDGDAVLNADDTVTYTPDAGFTGTDTFTYTVCDDAGRCDLATVTVTVLGDGRPDAADDAATTPADTPVVIDVLANDSDPDGDPLTVENASDPANGTAAVHADQTVSYTPDAGFTGIDTFTYDACDATGLCDTATVTVTVTAGAGAGKVTGGGWIPGPGSDGKRNFGFAVQEKSSGVSGRITYDRNSGGIDLKGTADSLAVSGNQATFSGPCELGGWAPCTYTAVVEDHGEPGAGTDRFSIQVFDATGQLVHQADDTLGGGNVQIH